jgi:aminoglycoside phosphotransferase (APT) family kinase protein
MAALHARLHARPADGFPAPAGSLLARRLGLMEEAVRQLDLPGLKPGLDWLCAHQPAPPERPSILHLDFHPFNLLQTPGGPLVVLDWNEADVGDYHADVAVTLTLLACFPLRPSFFLQAPVLWVGRHLLHWQYLLGYRLHRPLDPGKLAYYRGLAALHRICSYATWLRAGARASGYKPSSRWQLCPSHLQRLLTYFRQWTGVSVNL